MILKISYRHEVVIDAVLFTLTRGAGRGGDGVLNFRVLFQQSGNNGVLAGAGRAGDNKQIFFTFHRYFLFFFSFFVGTPGQAFQRDAGQNHMVRVHDEHGLGARP